MRRSVLRGIVLLLVCLQLAPGSARADEGGSPPSRSAPAPSTLPPPVVIVRRRGGRPVETPTPRPRKTPSRPTPARVPEALTQPRAPASNLPPPAMPGRTPEPAPAPAPVTGPAEQPAPEPAAPVPVDTAPPTLDALVPDLSGREVRRRVRPPIHGSARLEYRYRSTGDQSDHDAFLGLNFRVGDDRAPGWSGSFHGGLWADLDGPATEGSFDPLFSINDTFDHAVTGRIYHLHATYRPECGPVGLVRLGRQWSDAGDMFLFDGARIESTPRAGDKELVFRAFAGVPTHLFEDPWRGDAIAGVGARFRPVRGADASIDYVYIKDENAYYGTPESHLVTLSWHQQLSRGATLGLTYQHLDEKPRYLIGRVNTYWARSDLHLRCYARGLLQTQKQEAYDIDDAYYAVAQELKPYWEGDLAVSKGFGECFVVEAGAAGRVLVDAKDEGTFNREWQRYYLTASTADWPAPHWSLSLTGEVWSSVEDYQALVFDAEYRASRKFRFSVGTDYSLYRWNQVLNEERVNSYGVYASGRYRFTKALEAYLRARFEFDDFENYILIRAGLGLEF